MILPDGRGVVFLELPPYDKFIKELIDNDVPSEQIGQMTQENYEKEHAQAIGSFIKLYECVILSNVDIDYFNCLMSHVVDELFSHIEEK